MNDGSRRDNNGSKVMKMAEEVMKNGSSRSDGDDDDRGGKE